MHACKKTMNKRALYNIVHGYVRDNGHALTIQVNPMNKDLVSFFWPWIQ